MSEKAKQELAIEKAVISGDVLQALRDIIKNYNVTIIFKDCTFNQNIISNYPLPEPRKQGFEQR